MRKTARTKLNGAYLLKESSPFRLSLLAAFVLIFGLACLAAYASYRNAVHHTIGSNETRAELLGKIVLEHHKAAIGIVQSYASRPLLVDSVKKKHFEEALLHLTNLSKNNSEIETSWISNPDSTAWVNFPVDKRGYGRDLSHRDWYKGVSKEWRPYVSDIYKLITQEEGLVVSVCVPIRDEQGKVIGILGASLTTGSYNDLVTHISFDMDADITLVDREGHVICGTKYPDKKEITTYPFFDTVKSGMKKAAGTIEVRDTYDRGRVKFVSLAPVEEIDWSVVVEKPRSTVFYSILGELIQIAVISFLTLLVALYFVVNLGRQRRQLETLKKQSETLRDQALLLDLSRDAIFVTDMGLTITFWNAGAEALYGWTREEAIGKVCHELLQTAFPEPLDDVVAEATRNGRWEGLLRQRRKDGGMLTVSSRWVLRDEEGRPAGFMETNTDVTKRRQLEEQLRQAQKMEAVGTLAGGIAHDFNNVLAAIIGFTELTIDDAPEGSLMKRNMNYVLKAAIRGRDLVRQILTFSHKGDLKRIPLHLTPVVAEAVKLLRASLPATITLDFETDATADEVLADATEIDQLLMNLGANAAHAMREHGGRLTIALKAIELSPDSQLLHPDLAPGAYVELSVQDTGCGMDAETRHRIFEPFFTTKERGKGTGLGLAVVYGIVTSLGGAITVSSEVDRGAAFSIFLPKVTREQKTQPETVKEIRGGRERILFVDDEKLLVETAREMLGRLGYEVVATTDTTEALSIFSDEPERFHLVITDYTMPNVTGVDLAKNLMRIRPDIPIILCTGYTDMISRDEAHAMGICEFATKPLTRQEMAGMIRRVLDAKAQD